MSEHGAGKRHYTIMKVGKNYLGQNPWQTPPFVPPTKPHSLLPFPRWNTNWVIHLQYSSLLTSCLVSCNSSYCPPPIFTSLSNPYSYKPLPCFSFLCILVFLSHLLLSPVSFIIFCNIFSFTYFSSSLHSWHVENYCLKSPSFKKTWLHEWNKDLLRTWHTNIPPEFQTGQCARCLLKANRNHSILLQHLNKSSFQIISICKIITNIF